MVDLVGWESFAEPLDEGITFPSRQSVAVDVLETFGIKHSGTGGGALERVDLYRVDALSAIKASLLEELADTGGNLVEITVNSEGSVEFITIGSGASGLDGNILYTIKAASHVPSSVGVMVTGGKPKPERRMSPWKTLIGSDDEGHHGTIWDTHYLTSQCLAPQFSSSCAVTYDDPHLTTGTTNWRDGITGLFDFESPFENIIGYVWSVDPGYGAGDTVKIMAKNQTSVPILVSPSVPPRDYETGERPPIYKIGDVENFPNLGTLVDRTSADPSADKACWSDINSEKIECDASSVPITVSSFDFVKTVRGVPENKLIGVSNVFVKGVPLEACWGVVKDTSAFSQAPSYENTELFISSGEVTNTAQQIVRLSEGEDYVIGYAEDTWSTPCIKFANNVRKHDYVKCGTGVDFIVNDRDDTLKDIFKGGEKQGVSYGKGTVIPLGGQGAGFLIEQVWAQLELDLPCFLVTDPKGKALEVAERLVVRLAALSIYQEPEPIAINGVIVDQTEMQQDNDPTTAQPFSKSKYEEQMELMSSGRTLSIKLSSLDEGKTQTLCNNLERLLKDDDGKIWNHVCDPNATPKLGALGQFGYINSIEYSYSDSSSYLINVTEGPKFFGDVGGIGSGIYTKRTQDEQGVGTIIYDYGNHINFKVRVDGIGTVEAVNAYSGVLTVRDRINITIHNNEVEA